LVPIYGLVYAPKLNRIYRAIRGEGAFCNNKVIKVSNKNKIEDSVVSVMLTSHYSYKETKIATRIIENLNMKARGVRIFVCGSLELCFVAEGVLDAFISTKADPFGLAAGMLILHEAGGIITEISGKEVSIFSVNFIASNGKIHSKLQHILDKSLRENQYKSSL
jgi:myo-inositol-1(or 4)-monophosphatase